MKIRTLLITLTFITFSLLSCSEQSSQSNGTINGPEAGENVSIGIKDKDGNVTVLDPDILKNLAVKKEVKELVNPPEIPAHTFGRDYSNNLQTPYGELADPCYLHPELKELIGATDFTSKEVRTRAVRLAGNNPGNYNLGQTCDIFDFLVSSWKYVNDPLLKEYVAKASETIGNDFTGDCDDFAVALGSMIMAVGGDMRINYAFNPESGHAFVEANMGNLNLESVEQYVRVRYNIPAGTEVAMRREPNTGNLWLNMDWFAKHPGGPYFPYDQGVRYYVIGNHCESYTIISDLKKYNPKGNEIYEMLKLEN